MLDADSIVVKRGGRLVLDQVSLTADDGDVVGIVGPNGSGKSTCLLALYKALTLAGGRVTIDQADIAQMSRRTIATQMAVVAQDGEHSLPLSVRDAVALGRLSRSSLLGYGDQDDHVRVDRALAQVELSALSERLMTELSGGERQRVLIARAIAQESSHLLLDEPTNHLDLRHQFALMDLIDQLACTTIIVLHDLNLAARCCGKIIVLDRGRVIAAGTPDEVLQPVILEPIYRVRIQRITHDGRPHLIFNPAPVESGAV